MKLFIIRHGETALNKKGLIQGYIDTSLSNVGKQQAKKLAEKLVKFNIDVVYCSDLKRCKQTIEPFLKIKKNIQIHYTKELRERNYGKFEGQSGQKLNKWLKEKGVSESTKLPGGESYKDLEKRTSNFLRKLISKEKGRNVLLSTHGWTKKALLTHLLNKITKKNYMKGRMPNTALSIINIKDDGNHKVRLLNSTKHLDNK